MFGRGVSRLDEAIERIIDEVRVEWSVGNWHGTQWIILGLLFCVVALPGLVVGWLLTQLLPSGPARSICFVVLVAAVSAAVIGEWASRIGISALIALTMAQAIGMLVGTHKMWRLGGRKGAR